MSFSGIHMYDIMYSSTLICTKYCEILHYYEGKANYLFSKRIEWQSFMDGAASEIPGPLPARISL